MDKIFDDLYKKIIKYFINIKDRYEWINEYS